MQVAGPRRPSAVVDGGGAHDTPARGVLRHTQRRAQPPRQRSQERLAEATAGRTREGRRRSRVHGYVYFYFRRAIGMTSCFVNRWRDQSGPRAPRPTRGGATAHAR